MGLGQRRMLTFWWAGPWQGYSLPKAVPRQWAARARMWLLTSNAENFSAVSK